MSFAAGGWVYEQAVGSPAKKLVLLVLAEHYNKETKVTFPSIARMAAIAECDERTVKKALKELQDVGHIADSGKRTGQGKNVVVWRMPAFEAHIGAQNPSPYKNEGAEQNLPSGDSQPSEVASYSGGLSTENAQPLQKCGGSGDSGEVPRESAPTKMQSSPLIFAPAAPTKMGGESSQKNPLLTSGGAQTPPRAIPTGSRGAALGAQTQSQPFDAVASLTYWFNFALGHVLGSASVFGLCARGARHVGDLPNTVQAMPFRTPMRDLVKQLSDWAVDEDAKHWPDVEHRRRERTRIETEITARIDREMKPFIPATPASRASAAA